MKYYVMTLFPEMIEQGMNTSIMGRAMKQGLIELQVLNIRDNLFMIDCGEAAREFDSLFWK